MITELQQNIRERIVSHPFTKYRPVIMAWRVAKEMTTRDANHLAAGVVYYAIFALFPFILGGMVVADFFLDSEVLQREFLGFIIGNLPGSSGFIESNIDKIVQQRSSLVLISIVGLIWSSSSIFGAVNRVVNRAWNIYHTEPFHITRFRHLLSLAIFGFCSSSQRRSHPPCSYCRNETWGFGAASVPGAGGRQAGATIHCLDN